MVYRVHEGNKTFEDIAEALVLSEGLTKDVISYKQILAGSKVTNLCLFD